MKRPYPNNDQMSAEVSVLIRKNSHEVIRVTSDCQYYNEGADEMILTHFPALFCYWKLL
jgi:hypothetical protein